MRLLDQQLALLRAQKAQGADVDDAIADTLIAMVKDAYARGDIEIEQLASTVTAILGGRPIALMQPGEIVLRPGAPTDLKRTDRLLQHANQDVGS